MRAGNSDRAEGGACLYRTTRSSPAEPGFPLAMLSTLLPSSQFSSSTLTSLVFSTTIPVSKVVLFFPPFCFSRPRTQFGLSFVHLLVDVLRFQEASFCVFFAFVSRTVSVLYFELNPPLWPLDPASSLRDIEIHSSRACRLFAQLSEIKALVCLPASVVTTSNSSSCTLRRAAIRLNHPRANPPRFPTLVQVVGPEICASATLFDSEQSLFPAERRR